MPIAPWKCASRFASTLHKRSAHLGTDGVLHLLWSHITKVSPGFWCKLSWLCDLTFSTNMKFILNSSCLATSYVQKQWGGGTSHCYEMFLVIPVGLPWFYLAWNFILKLKVGDVDYDRDSRGLSGLWPLWVVVFVFWRDIFKLIYIK